MAGIKTWWLAIRPKTLTAAFVPVGVGTALAFAHGVERLDAAAAALFVALFIQIGTNLANDYFDFRKGADTNARLGPTRVTQSGMLPPAQVLIASIVAFVAAFGCGLYLVALGGWPLLIVGLVSILCGFAYTGGPFPLGYNGLGDLFVFVFFGGVAVVGTYYVQALAFHPMAFVLSAHVGATAVALIVVNNLRDINTDKLAGKNTLAVKIGPRLTRLQYIAMLVLAYLVPVGAVVSGAGHPAWLLALLTLPFAWHLGRAVYRLKGRELNTLLAQTAKFQLLTGALLVAGIVLAVFVAKPTTALPSAARSIDSHVVSSPSLEHGSDIGPEGFHSQLRVMLPVDASTKNWRSSTDVPSLHGSIVRMNRLKANIHALKEDV